MLMLMSMIAQASAMQLALVVALALLLALLVVNGDAAIAKAIHCFQFFPTVQPSSELRDTQSFPHV